MGPVRPGDGRVGSERRGSRAKAHRYLIRALDRGQVPVETISHIQRVGGTRSLKVGRAARPRVCIDVVHLKLHLVREVLDRDIAHVQVDVGNPHALERRDAVYELEETPPSVAAKGLDEIGTFVGDPGPAHVSDGGRC